MLLIISIPFIALVIIVVGKIINIRRKISYERSTQNRVMLFIKDNGIGIEKKFLKKVFDKFEQIHNNSIKNESSTGLGLTITKELVKLHKGKIKIDSIPKIGTTFTIILPI